MCALIGVLYKNFISGMLKHDGVRENIHVVLYSVSTSFEGFVRRNTNVLGIVNKRVTADTCG